jgi:hypothetical protein
MKLGEISLPLLIKKHYSIPLKEGFSILFLTNVADLFFLLFSLVLIVVIDYQLFIDILAKHYMAIFLFILLLITLLFISLKVFIRKKNAFINAINKLDYKVASYTFLIWLMLILQMYCVLLSIFPEVSYLFILLLNLFGALFILTPFQGLANIGNYELSWLISSEFIADTANYNMTIAASTHILITILVTIILAVTIVRKFILFLTHSVNNK